MESSRGGGGGRGGEDEEESSILWKKIQISQFRQHTQNRCEGGGEGTLGGKKRGLGGAQKKKGKNVRISLSTGTLTSPAAPAPSPLPDECNKGLEMEMLV